MHQPASTCGSVGDGQTASSAECVTGPAVGGPVAELHGVGFGYEPGTPVVTDVTAKLRPGRVCALIGPNAAGKSTLLKLMLGQLDPWQGSAELAGRPVAALAPRHRAALASYVPQKGGISFAFTVRQVVTMGRFASGDHDEAVDRALSMCDLAGLQHRVFAHLSGGQQQRVLLARAVAQSTGGGRVMFLDEPASGMDLWHVHQTMRLLRRLAHGDPPGPACAPACAPLGVLVVLHDVNLAARYADDVWLMDDGRLVAAGPWQEVLLPKLLEPVYRVGFKTIQAPAGGPTGDGPQRCASPPRPENGTDHPPRPVFWIDPPDTID